MVPSILNDSTAFSLDFEGSVLPETSKIEKKCIWKFLVFLIVKKHSQDLFFRSWAPFWGQFWTHFWSPGSILGSVLEPGAVKTCDIRSSIFVFFLEGAFSQFGLAFCLQNHLFYDGVFQNLAFRSRLTPKVPQTC